MASQSQTTCFGNTMYLIRKVRFWSTCVFRRMNYLEWSGIDLHKGTFCFLFSIRHSCILSKESDAGFYILKIILLESSHFWPKFATAFHCLLWRKHITVIGLLSSTCYLISGCGITCWSSLWLIFSVTKRILSVPKSSALSIIWWLNGFLTDHVFKNTKRCYFLP